MPNNIPGNPSFCSFASFCFFNPNGIKTLLANDLRTFSIKGNPVFSNGLPKNPTD